MFRYHVEKKSDRAVGLEKGIYNWNNSYVFLILLISFATDYHKQYPWLIIGFLLFEACAIAAQNYIEFNFNKALKGKRAWMAFVMTELHCAALIWSGFTLTTLLLFGLAWPGFLVVLASFSLVILSLVFMRPINASVNRYVIILIVPICAWGVLEQNPMGYALVFSSMVILASLSVTYPSLGGSDSDTDSLHRRTNALVKMNKELEREILYRKNMEKALRRSEERYRTLFQNNPIETIIVDHQARITGYNSAKARAHGRVPEIGDIMYKDYGSRHENNMFEELMDCIRTGCPKEFPEQKYNDRFLHIRISPYSGGAIITSLDITKSKRAEAQIQILTREIMRVQEHERQRIARDLHDSVAQDLSSLRISCETFFDEDAGSAPIVRKKINEISRILLGSINAVRDIAYELRPPCLDELGLPITLFRYCEDFTNRTGIHVDFFSAGLEQFRMDAESEINLYRLVQEALNNIRKHSKATRATVRLVASYPYVILRIDDNGIGFEIDLQSQISLKNKRMGLRSMEERVNLLGGRINVKTSPGSGTRFFIEVPIVKKLDDIQITLAKNVPN